MVSFNARNREEEVDDHDFDIKKTDQEEKFAWQENLREDDPWKHVKDIKGDLHYRVLSIPRNATVRELKRRIGKKRANIIRIKAVAAKRSIKCKKRSRRCPVPRNESSTTGYNT